MKIVQLISTRLREKLDFALWASFSRNEKLSPGTMQHFRGIEQNQSLFFSETYLWRSCITSCETQPCRCAVLVAPLLFLPLVKESRMDTLCWSENDAAWFALWWAGALLTKGTWLPASYSAVCLFVKWNGIALTETKASLLQTLEKEAAGSRASANNLNCINVGTKQVDRVNVVDNN